MRKLCPTCKEVWMEAPPDRLKPWIPKGTPLYRAAGCPDCAMTGYRGRFSIMEVLTVTPEVESRIAAGEPAERIAKAARRGGMKSLWDSGLAHVLRGESTVDELMRVVDVPQEDVAEPVPAAGGRNGFRHVLLRNVDHAHQLVHGGFASEHVGQPRVPQRFHTAAPCRLRDPLRGLARRDAALDLGRDREHLHNRKPSPVPRHRTVGATGRAVQRRPFGNPRLQPVGRRFHPDFLARGAELAH